METVNDRRSFLAGLSAFGAAGMVGGTRAIAEETPPETTTVRLALTIPAGCLAPAFVAEELLHAEGFTDVAYVPAEGGFTFPQMIARGDVDFGISFAGSVVYHLDKGHPILAVGAVHSGCYELFAHDPIRTVGDLRGKRIGINNFSTSAHLYVAIMAKHVGLDPHSDFEWVTSEAGKPIELFAAGEVDAFIGFPPEPQDLKSRNIGRVIVNTAIDRPWSQYLCCFLISSRRFVADYPVATKRVIRSILKAADFCAAEPERVARLLVDRGQADRYDFQLQALQETPYTRWRDFDADDALRFYALRLHEAGMIKSSPQGLIADGTDWRFFNELKRELKA